LVVFVLQVGLAVGDIDSIQKTASLRTLIDQAFLVDNIQKKYPKTLLRLGYKESMEISPNQNTFIKRWVYHSITFPQNTGISYLTNYVLLYIFLNNGLPILFSKDQAIFTTF